MKHLITYSLFESTFTGQYSLDDIRDMLLEVSDLGLLTRVQGGVRIANGNIETQIKIYENSSRQVNKINWNEIKDAVERIFEYLKSYNIEDVELFINGELVTNYNIIKKISTVSIYFSEEEKITENFYSQLGETDITLDIRHICLDLEDQGFSISLYNHTMLDGVTILITKMVHGVSLFKYEEIEETVKELKDYLGNKIIYDKPFMSEAGFSPNILYYEIVFKNKPLKN